MTLTQIHVHALEQSKTKEQSWIEYLKNCMYGSYLLPLRRLTCPEKAKIASEMFNYETEDDKLLSEE